MGPQKILKVVLDTNVVISALLFKGVSNEMVDLWQSRKIRFLASGAIVREYARVLSYPKFRLSEDEARALLTEVILPFVNPITVDVVPAVVTEDPSDDQFLACAMAGKADLLVSGDVHLLKLKTYERLPIVTIRQFLDRVH